MARGKGSKGTRRKAAKQRRELELLEIEELNRRVEEEAPARGANLLVDDKEEGDKGTGAKGGKKKKGEGEEQDLLKLQRTFEELPISKATLEGLEEAGFKRMTQIQRASLPHSLCGRDVLAAAKTGSGKTLAFLVPVLEKLYRQQWTPDDGLGALIISPTRELALQIFEVLRKIGGKHSISAGLVIGGKDADEEQKHLLHMNVLVCTPGRILHHLDTCVGFDTTSLQLLVLDEADRILDMGFQRTLNAVLEGLPPRRQTLLFSATQTKSVRQLARLSLSHPEYVAVHEQSKFATPKNLDQCVLVCPLEKKLDTIWSFVRSHLQHKCIIFFSSCKQVKFVHEAFRQLRPGVPVLALHGKMKQMKRMGVYVRFCEQEDGCVLFATDLAARGLDFPDVDWVVQADCPEDADTYLHRVGRTARYHNAGRALLLLLPSETTMLDLLEQRKVPLRAIKANPKQMTTVMGKLQAMLSRDQDLKYLAQKSVVSYMRSVYLASNKEVFDVEQLPATEFAQSIGLAGAPRIRFVKKARPDKNLMTEGQGTHTKLDDSEDESENGGGTSEKVRAKESGRESERESDSDEEEESDNERTTQKPKKEQIARADRLRQRKNQTVLSSHYERLRESIDEGDDDDLMVVKRANHELEEEDADLPPPMPVLSKKKRKLLASGAALDTSAFGRTRVKFDDDGNALKPLQALVQERNLEGPTAPADSKAYFDDLRSQLKEADKEDKRQHYDRLKEAKLKKRMQQMGGGPEAREETVVTIGGGDFSDGEYSDLEQSDDESMGANDSGSEQGSESDNESESESDRGLGKRAKATGDGETVKKKRKAFAAPQNIEDQEALALRLLESKGLL